MNGGIYNEEGNKGIQAGGNVVIHKETKAINLSELISLIDATRSSLSKEEAMNKSDQNKVDKSLGSAKEELKNPKPNLKRVLKFMQNAAKALKSTTTITTSSIKLISLIEKGISWLTKAI